MGKTVWENYVYQPLSSAIIHLNRENQKFQEFFGFLVTAGIALIGLMLQVYPERIEGLRSGFCSLINKVWQHF